MGQSHQAHLAGSTGATDGTVGEYILLHVVKHAVGFLQQIVSCHETIDFSIRRGLNDCLICRLEHFKDFGLSSALFDLVKSDDRLGLRASRVDFLVDLRRED